MLLVASGRKTAIERKSYDARLILGGPGTGILYRAPKQASKRGFLKKRKFEGRTHKIGVCNSTELKGRPEVIELHFYESKRVPASLGQA